MGALLMTRLIAPWLLVVALAAAAVTCAIAWSPGILQQLVP